MKKLIVYLTTALLSFSAYSTSPVYNEIINGKQYITLQNLLSPQKEVIEFFSFYCSACYLAETDYQLPQTIKKNLPHGATMKKYHVDGFGGLSDELSEAWAIANVLGIADKAAKTLFEGIHKTNSIKTVDDIKKAFASLDVPSEKYDAMKTNFSVQVFLSQQTNAFNQLQPNAVPSFFVNNKYQVISQNLLASTKEALVNDHSRVINYLIAQDKK